MELVNNMKNTGLEIIKLITEGDESNNIDKIDNNIDIENLENNNDLDNLDIQNDDELA